MDFTLGLGNPDPDLTAAVSPAWVHLMRSTVVSNVMVRIILVKAEIFHFSPFSDTLLGREHYSNCYDYVPQRRESYHEYDHH